MPPATTAASSTSRRTTRSGRSATRSASRTRRLTLSRNGSGSHARWQRALPNYGIKPSATRAVWELRVSHWTGEIAVFEVSLNWAYRRFHHVYGRLTYQDRPVYGFFWEAEAPGPYDRELDAPANDEIRELDDPSCRPN